MKNLRELAPYEEDPRARAGGSAPANPVRRMPAGNAEQAFFHFDFLRALEMHRKLATGIFLAALLLAGAYLARRWNNYKAESLVYVQPAPPHLLESPQGQQSWPYDANTYESYIQQQIHNVTRPDVLAAAVGRIEGFKGENESVQAAADRLNGNIEVTRVSTGYQISIAATASGADQAAQMSNAVAQSFIDSATRELRSGDVQRLELLREERDRVQKELASDRAEQDALNKQLGVAAVGMATPDPYDDQIAATRSELVKARTDNDEAAAKLMATAGAGPSSAALDAAADEIVAADPGLVSMKTALNKRRSELISQMANLTPNHPLYKQDAEELAKINSSLETMSKDLRAKAAAQIEQKLKSDLERTSSVEARLNAQLAQMTNQAGSATPRLQRANDLATDISRLQARFTTVDEQYRNLTMENAAPGAVYLSAAAVPPLHAERNKVFRNAAVILLIGLVFAAGAALIAHNYDPRIYIAADVERLLGFAPMALLPDLYEVGTGVAEEYMLRLAAAVEHAHQQGSLHSCIFTGVAAGAGATTISTRVTSMLQAMGRDTMLVDAVGSAPREDVHPGTELVHAPRGTRSTALLQQMSERADEDTIVVTDTAPLLVSGETEYLARFVDSAIVIIESGVTTKTQLQEVAQTLERLDIGAVGFVLNRISLENANASFRQSVRAVEKHLKAQTRAFDHKRPRPEAGSQEPFRTPEPFRTSEPRPSTESRAAAVRETEHGTPERSAAIFERLREVVADPAERPAPPASRWESASEAESEPAPPLNERETAEEPVKDDLSAASSWAEPAGSPDRALAQQPAAEPASFADPYRTPSWLDSYVADMGRQVPQEPAASEPAKPEWLTERTLPADEPTVSATAPYESVQKWESTPPAPAAFAVLQHEEDRGLPSYLRRPQDAAPAYEVQDRSLPDYLRRSGEEFETPAAMPVPSPEPAPALSSAKDEAPAIRKEAAPAGPTVPARPKRGREGVHVILGRKPSAPLSGDEVPDAWRAALRAEAAEIDRSEPAPLPPAALPEQEPVPEMPAFDFTSRRTSPFAEIAERREEPAPLKEWWEELDPEPQPAAAEGSAHGEPAAPPAEDPAAFAVPQLDEVDEGLARAASRLGGLRNLLVTLGIQNLHHGAELRKAEAQMEHAPERAIYAQPIEPNSNSDLIGAEVTARPEIIPPRANMELIEREKELKAPAKTPAKPARVTRWDSPDDVEILPARRGQYRRRH